MNVGLHLLLLDLICFCLLQVHPDWYYLLCYRMDQLFYYAICLPMGCSTLLNFYKLCSSLLEWVSTYETGSRSFIHNLDEFLFVALGGSGQCTAGHLFILYSIFWGSVEKNIKNGRPSVILSFLGMDYDSAAMVFDLVEVFILRQRRH